MTTLDVVTAKQWDSNSGGFEYRSLATGCLPVADVLKMVDDIAATPSLERLGDEYGGSRGWVIVQNDHTIFHAYIDDNAKIEYYGTEAKEPLETDGIPGLYCFVDLDSLKRALTLLSESQPIVAFLRTQSIHPPE